MAAESPNPTDFGEVSRWQGIAFKYVCLAAALSGIVTLLGLLVYVTVDAAGWLTLDFLLNPPSFRDPQAAGIFPALVGTMFLLVLITVISFPLGVGAAIYLEEYASDNRYTQLIETNIANLAGVPSVVYGLLGLGLFVNVAGMPYGSVLAGAFTISLLILPIVIISAQEAIRAVPDSMRQASYGMGATQWQTVRDVVLPEALPGILTGTILSLGRAIGETAPLIMIGAPTSVFSAPTGILDKVSAMPMQIFTWADMPQEGFRHGVVAAGVVTLLAVLLAMNSVAIYIRNRYQRRS